MGDFVVIIGGAGCVGFLTGTAVYFGVRKIRRVRRNRRGYRWVRYL